MRTNKWVLERIGSDMVLQNNILERKLCYFGHVIRNDISIENSSKGQWKVAEAEDVQ